MLNSVWVSAFAFELLQTILLPILVSYPVSSTCELTYGERSGLAITLFSNHHAATILTIEVETPGQLGLDSMTKAHDKLLRPTFWSRQTSAPLSQIGKVIALVLILIDTLPGLLSTLVAWVLNPK